MTTIYNIDSFTKGQNGFALPFCTQVYSATLKASTEETLTVPATAGMGLPAATANNKFIAIMSWTSGDDVFFCKNGTAAVPAGAAFAASTSELLGPGNYGKFCQTGDTLHFISAGTPSVTVAFYAIVD